MTNPELVLGFVGVVTTLGGSWMAMRLLPLEKDIKANEKSIELGMATTHETINTMRSDFERRIAAIHEDSKAERDNMERRLSGIERVYVSREELANTINAIGGRFDRGIDRMENSIKNLGDKIDSLGTRVTRIEGSSV